MHRGFALSVAGSQSALAEEQYSESDAIALEQEERERFTKEIRKSLQSSSTKNKIDALRKILAVRNTCNIQ